MQTILLVEDDPVHVAMYRTLLEDNKYDVEVALNGEEGLERAFNSHPDLIILDIRMPVMDGLHMLQELREDSWGKEAKVMILTNMDKTIRASEFIKKHNLHAYLVKTDTTPKFLLMKIQEVLDNQSQ